MEKERGDLQSTIFSVEAYNSKKDGTRWREIQSQRSLYFITSLP